MVLVHKRKKKKKENIKTCSHQTKTKNNVLFFEYMDFSNECSKACKKSFPKNTIQMEKKYDLLWIYYVALQLYHFIDGI